MNGDAFTQLEHAGWERVAGNYDSVWASLTRQFIEPLLNAAGVARGMQVLDVACGPGYVAAVAQQRGADAVGIDFSREMVGIARRLHPDIDFHEVDAQQLQFDEMSFDRVVMNFGLLHLSHPENA